MSRARPFIKEDGTKMWMDQRSRATVEQLELLADYEGNDLDDLLDEGLTQKQVLFRLRLASGTNLIPQEVLDRRRKRHFEANAIPTCRICSLNGWECEGRITRHHFVVKWLMRELENYVSYASRTACTIPICIGRHRDLHFRSEHEGGYSIVPYLRDHERKFAHKLLDELKEQRPHLYELIQAGDGDYSYEAQLLEDHISGRFIRDKNPFDLPEYNYDLDKHIVSVVQ